MKSKKAIIELLSVYRRQHPRRLTANVKDMEAWADALEWVLNMKLEDIDKELGITAKSKSIITNEMKV